MESINPIKYGSSKLVPSVQELSKQHMATPPERYIKFHQEPPVISTLPLDVVPVINMQKLLYEDSMEHELQRLHSACKEWGFFQLVNHGVDKILVENIKNEIQEFFKLPFEEKKKFWQSENELEGFGQAFVVSDEQKLDWSDMFFINTQPINSRKPHLFPYLPLHFRRTLDDYSLELKTLATKILQLMENALKVEGKEITELFEEGIQSMRMNYYPPCPEPDKVIGLNPHSDPIGLTILLQVNEMEGLQVKKDGKWIPIKPLENAFIVNIGNILEIVTNGVYHSIEHRATVNKVKERLSIATYYYPRFEVEMGPAKSLVTDQTPAMYRRIMVHEYFRKLFTREFGTSFIEDMKIGNERELGGKSSDSNTQHENKKC